MLGLTRDSNQSILKKKLPDLYLKLKSITATYHCLDGKHFLIDHQKKQGERS